MHGADAPGRKGRGERKRIRTYIPDLRLPSLLFPPSCCRSPSPWAAKSGRLGTAPHPPPNCTSFHPSVHSSTCRCLCPFRISRPPTMTVSITSTLLLLAGILLASTLLSFPLAHADQVADQVAEEAADGPDRRTRRSGRVSKKPYERTGKKKGVLTAEKARLALESADMEAPEAAAGTGAGPSDRIPPRGTHDTDHAMRVFIRGLPGATRTFHGLTD